MSPRSARLSASKKSITTRRKTRHSMRVSRMNKQTERIPKVSDSIEVYWDADDRYYKGTLTVNNSNEHSFRIMYDDGEMEDLDLRNEVWRFADMDKPNGTTKIPQDKNTTKKQTHAKQNSAKQTPAKQPPAKQPSGKQTPVKLPQAVTKSSPTGKATSSTKLNKPKNKKQPLKKPKVEQGKQLATQKESHQKQPTVQPPNIKTNDNHNPPAQKRSKPTPSKSPSTKPAHVINKPPHATPKSISPNNKPKSKTPAINPLDPTVKSHNMPVENKPTSNTLTNDPNVNKLLANVPALPTPRELEQVREERMKEKDMTAATKVLTLYDKKANRPLSKKSDSTTQQRKQDSWLGASQEVIWTGKKRTRLDSEEHSNKRLKSAKLLSKQFDNIQLNQKPPENTQPEATKKVTNLTSLQNDPMHLVLEQTKQHVDRCLQPISEQLGDTRKDLLEMKTVMIALRQENEFYRNMIHTIVVGETAKLRRDMSDVKDEISQFVGEKVTEATNHFVTLIKDVLKESVISNQLRSFNGQQNVMAANRFHMAQSSHTALAPTGQRHATNPSIGRTIQHASPTAIASLPPDRVEVLNGEQMPSQKHDDQLMNTGNDLMGRINALISRQVTVWLLETPHEYTKRDGERAWSVQEWAKATASRAFAASASFLSRHRNFHLAITALQNTLGGGSVELDWFHDGGENKHLENARKNYSAWDPPPTDEEWFAEMSLLREISGRYRRIVRDLEIAANETELQIAILIANRAATMHEDVEGGQ